MIFSGLVNCLNQVCSFHRLLNTLITLTLSWRRLLSYRNQSTDLQSKSMDWFLYDNVLRHKRVKRRNWLQIESRFQKKKNCSRIIFDNSRDYFNITQRISQKKKHTFNSQLIKVNSTWKKKFKKRFFPKINYWQFQCGNSAIQ